MNEEVFDNQIREALRTDVPPEQVERLSAFWDCVSRRERRKRMVRRGVALAASLLVATSLAGWIARQPMDGVEVAQVPRPIERSVPKPVELPPAPRQLVTQGASSPSMGREPTALEQLAFYSQRSPRGSAANENLAAVVDDLVQLVVHENIDPQRAVEDAGIAMAGIERELLRRLGRSKDDQKRALLQLLAVSGSEKSTPALLKLSRREEFRDEALATIEQIVGVAGLAEVVRAANDPQVRRLLMQRLLAAESVGEFLQLAQDPALCGEALATAATARNVPTDALFAALQSDQVPERLAAALVLGRVNGPAITRRLVALVTAERPAPTEAWLALLTCRGELAEEFMSYATSRPQLLGQMNQARVQWARLNL